MTDYEWIKFGRLIDEAEKQGLFLFLFRFSPWRKAKHWTAIMEKLPREQESELHNGGHRNDAGSPLEAVAGALKTWEEKSP